MLKFLFIGLIYGASWCYVLAQYFHLTLKDWSFAKAMLIAMPLVVLEYALALHGNKQAAAVLSPVQIFTLTIGFYALNLIILNVLILKGAFVPARDGLALILIGVAIFISQSGR